MFKISDIYSKERQEYPCFIYHINIMAADDLAMPVTRASTAMVLTFYAYNILDPKWEGLRIYNTKGNKIITK